MKGLREDFAKKGRVEGKVEVQVSYDIIRQFSMQLYTNPRKAIEELVCNSYDAGATECHIRIPHTQAAPLVVLDDGISMDFEGLQDLWKVAESPKVRSTGESRVDNNRAQIGKFGVGKLAAFALGSRLTHVTVKGKTARIVSVGQEEIKMQGATGKPTFDVCSISADEARAIVEQHLEGMPNPWKRKWKSWTMAVVEDIVPANVGRALKIGYLHRMIRTSIPISSNFRIYLEGDLIEPRKIDPTEVMARVEVASEEFQGKAEAALRAFWARQRDESEDVIPTHLYECAIVETPNPQHTSEQVTAMFVPGLGPVIGRAFVTKNSLITKKVAERGYDDNGFRIQVHGKQINPEDPLFGISQRSHRYWIRFLGELEIPGLDEALLVQRNAVSENNDKTLIAREVAKTLFNYSRAVAQEKEEKEEEYKPSSFGSRLKRLSPFLGPLALRGLVRHEWPSEGLDAVSIQFVTLGDDDPAVRYDAARNVVAVNDEHPLIKAMAEVGVKGRQLRIVVSEVLAATVMARGYLRAQGVDEEVLLDVEAILEDAFRSAAGYVRDEVEEHIEEIETASHEGGTLFEKAVVQAFRSLRLSARHVGGADLPDGVISIPRAGQKNLLLSVEAKGSKGIVTHEQLRTSTVERHRDGFDCEHATAIAREFQLEGRGDKPSALVREAKGKMSLLRVTSIAKLLRLHRVRAFTYDKRICLPPAPINQAGAVPVLATELGGWR